MPLNSKATLSQPKETKASQLRKHGGGKSAYTYKQREMNKLDIDNKQMEWRLHQLKQTMEQEKKDRSQVGSIWESAKTRTINFPTRPLPKTNPEKKSVKPRPKTERSRKVVVLKDEPIDVPKRKSKYSNLIEKLSKEDPALAENYKGNKRHEEEKQAWISIAKSRNSEEILDIQSDAEGNLPLSSIHTINQNAVGLFFVKWGRKRILPAVDDKVICPKAGWGKETYYPYVSSINWQPTKPTAPPSYTLNNDSPKASRTPKSANYNRKPETPKQKQKPVKTGGKLLEGSFDEDESAKSFQQALQQWRSEPTEPAPSEDKVELKGQVERTEIAVHAVQSDPLEIEINFTQTSTLTDEERDMLARHRASSIPPLNPLHVNVHESSQAEDNLEAFHDLNEQMQEERERMRDIFSSALPPAHIHHVASSVSFAEVTDDGYDEGCVDGNTSEYTIEVPAATTDDQSSAQIERPMSSVTIKEFDFSTGDDNAVPHSGAQSITKSKSTNIPVHLSLDKGKSLSEVAALSVDPKAVYKHGLGEFFTGRASVQGNIDQTVNHSPTEERGDLIKTDVQWQPMRSLVSARDGRRRRSSGRSRIEDPFPTRRDLDSRQSRNVEEIETLEEIESVIERERADQEHLQSLEWELASQTGNLTDDGRISRLIDQWPASDEDDTRLGIINDPGTDSGLTTPDVDRFKWADNMSATQQAARSGENENDAGDVSKPWSSPSNARFEKIERYMMGNLSESDE